MVFFTSGVNWIKEDFTSISCRLRYAPFRSLLHQLATAYGLRSLRRRTPDYGARRLQGGYIPVTGVARRSERQRGVPEG